MLSRILRSVTKNFRTPTASGTHELEIDETRSIKNITNSENYNIDSVIKVIRSYYFIYAKAREKNTVTNIKNEPMIRESLRNLLPIVKEMNTDQLLLLIRNLYLMKIRFNAIWEEIEKILLESTDFISPRNYISLVLAFSESSRKNSELWSVLESKLIEFIENDASDYSGRELRIILSCFTLVNQGSDKLHEILIKGCAQDLSLLNHANIAEYIIALTRLSPKYQEELKTALEKYVTKEGSFFNAIHFMVCFKCALKAKLDDKLISKFEETFFEKIEFIPRVGYAKIPKLYALLAVDHPEFDKRKEFLVKVEKDFSSRRSKYYSDERFAAAPFYPEVKFFWGLSKFDICNDKQLWRSFLDTFKQGKESLVDSMKEEYAEIEAFAQKKELI